MSALQFLEKPITLLGKSIIGLRTRVSGAGWALVMLGRALSWLIPGRRPVPSLALTPNQKIRATTGWAIIGGCSVFGIMFLLTGSNISAGMVLVGGTLATITVTAWDKRHEILNQMYVCGIESLGVTMFVAFFIGFILALQAGVQLKEFGQEQLIGALVSVSMVREMGPFMTGLICAANVGSAMAAELGTMKVSEEVDALEVMTIDPTRFLVLPRILGMTLMCPILTMVTNIVGIFGGFVIGMTYFDVKGLIYYRLAIEILSLKDLYTGLLKALVFGCVIATVGCAMGLRASGGAIGVGQATRRSVIVSFLFILLFGFFITALFFGVSV